MSSFRGFGVFCGSLVLGDKSEYVVAASQYRAAANTAMGWKNSNLRTEMTLLLQGEFPLHVVCSWLGNSPRIAQQSYPIVTEDDFAKLACVAKVMVST